MKFFGIEERWRKPAAQAAATADEYAKPAGIVALTGADGRKIFVATAAISSVWEAEGVQKPQGVSAMVFFRDAPDGCASVNVRESHEEVIAAWRMAMGLKGGTI